MNYVNEIEVIYKPRLDITPLQKITSAENIVSFFRDVWADDIEFRERFYVLYLNKQNKILGYYLLSIGSSCATVVETKMVFQPAINLHACSIVLAHNHPSGNRNPSNADLKLTSTIVNAGKILDVPVLDHIILTVDNFYSFVENNCLN